MLTAKMWHAQAIANTRHTNNVVADKIANAIHRIVDAMQLVVAQPRAMIPPARLVKMEDFRRHKPTKFTSKATLDEANA